MLRQDTDPVEADLRRFYDVRLGDLWRRDEHGRRLLSTREVFVMVRFLPAESALAIRDNGGKQAWTLEASLLADLWEQKANTGRKKSQPAVKHPGRPKPRKTVDPGRERRLAEARRRKQARDMRLNQPSGE